MAAVIEEFNGSPQATWACIYKSYRESNHIIGEMSKTINKGYEKLYAADIKAVEEQIKKLQMHLNILRAGYEELENQTRPL